MTKKIELLAPAGDFPSLIGAVEAGADAVYFGLKDFNMRQSAKNFSMKDLTKINKICNDNNVKKYLTLNIIIYDSELKKLESLIKKVRGKVDAIICWDLSVIGLCKKYKIPFHISTQASVSNSASAKFYKKLGAERVVLARELSLKQIKKIGKIADVECFIHGAMCVSVSGRCFTSQFLKNKSANRGECRQFCRRSYVIKDDAGNELKLKNNKVMSAKDLCTLPFIDKLKKSGIVSFKIEGRNRSPEYVRTVVSVYRTALDKKLNDKDTKKLLEKLKTVYHRDMSSGFYLGLPTSDDFSKSNFGESTERKMFIGKITKYWPKSGTAAVKLNAGTLKLKDEVYIIGNTTGIKRVKIKSIERHNKNIKTVTKGMTVGIKVPKCKKGDDVYIIK
ncbi:MAG: U32 family peptidase [Candidatus Aenigmarchaeota archaeon]|nr:U32 family peptidase [Candidatus Aenigmarchaeota archaeon]